ncbi:MAG TPA: hypothetical protein VLX92_04405, partial [Kofleriaceae bacterium]|nr:hypothetical protein [Kofleriaceae bacterium]
PELIARDQHTVYVFHADDTLHPIARLPYGQRDGVCASELRVEGDQLIVEDYAVTRYGDDACQLRTIRHYRFAPGRIDLGRVTIDN